jgi:hypothetical protein
MLFTPGSLCEKIRILDQGSEINIPYPISTSVVTIIGSKILKFFVADPDLGLRRLFGFGCGIEKLGSATPNKWKI